MNRPLVIDIYQGDNVSDFSKTVAFGIIGCIHKATEGLTLVDKRYAARRKMWSDAGGELWGAYCFFHGNDPVAEADFFLTCAEPDNNTLLAIDWETTLGGKEAVQLSARMFVERVCEKAGRPWIWVYSGNVAKEQIHGVDPFWSKQKLWLAQYASTWKTQASWREPDLWQNNGDQWGPGPNKIPGVDGYCDNSTIVSGIVDDLRNKWTGLAKSVTPVPQQPPVIVETPVPNTQPPSPPLTVPAPVVLQPGQSIVLPHIDFNIDAIKNGILTLQSLLPIVSTFIPQLKVAAPFLPIILGLVQMAQDLEAAGHDPAAIAKVVSEHLHQIADQLKSVFPA